MPRKKNEESFGRKKRICITGNLSALDMADLRRLSCIGKTREEGDVR
jgi:hypothetical protein